MKFSLPVHLFPVIDACIDGLCNFRTALKNQISKANPLRVIPDSNLYFESAVACAEYLKISERTFFKYVNKGIIPVTYLADGKRFYLKSEMYYLAGNVPLFQNFQKANKEKMLRIVPLDSRDGTTAHKFHYGRFHGFNTSPDSYSIDQVQLACMLLLLLNKKITEKEYEDCKCALAA